MVVSKACMMVAVIAHTVTSMRNVFGCNDAKRGLIYVRPYPLRRRYIRKMNARLFLLLGCGREERDAAVAGVDFDIHAHAGAQQAGVLVLVEGDAHGHALHHFDPVPGGVLRRQNGELRAGAGTHGYDMTGEGMIGETVDVE